MDAIHHRLVSRVSVVMTPEGKPRVIDIKPLMSPPPGKPALAAAGNTRAEGQTVGQRPVSEGHDPASAPSKVPVKRQPEYEDVTEDEDMDVETDDDTGSSDLEITDETPGLSAAELQERQDKETAAEQLLCLSSDIRTKSSTAAGRKAFGSLSKMDTHPRQRLRPWLEAMIDRGNIPGLQWMDQDRSRFRIPWKHGGKQDWTPENSRIFLEWAKHTGKYREGIDKADYATWKTRLRCAFNKAPDIIEERDLTELNTTEPYRVYKLVPKKDRGRMTLSDPTHSDSDTEMETAPRPAYTPSAVGSMLPLVVEEMAASVKSDMLSSLPSDLKSLAEDDLLRGTITSEGLQLANIEGQDLTNAVISVSHGGVRRTEQLAQPRRAVTSPGVALAQVFPTEDGPCVARVMAPTSSPSSSSASSGPPYVDRGSALARLPVYQKANVTAGPDDAQNVVEVTRYRGHDVDEALDEEHYMELVPQELIPEAMDEEEVEVVVSQTAAVTRNYHQLTQLNPALLSTSVYQGDPVAVTTACLTSTVAGPQCHVMTTLSTGVTGVPGAPLTVEADGSVMMIQQSTQLEQDSGVDIELKFCNETVVRMRMDNVHGCRLASRPPIPPDAAVAQAVYGPENASQIYFPIPQPYHVRQRPDLELQAQLLLKYLERGVLVHYDQGDIYATRLCQCGVHYASEVGTQGAPIKLKRDEHQVKIFDFQGGFMTALTRHAQGLGSPLPSPQVHLQFGQVFDLAKVDNNLLISATITSRLAAQLVQDTGSSEYQASRNNDPDDMIAELQRRVSGVSSTTVQAAPAPAQSPAGHSPPPSPVGNVLPEASSPSSDIYPVTTSPQSRSEVVVITSL
nr:interferon regulatory factor-like protein [Arenicola marina]